MVRRFGRGIATLLVFCALVVLALWAVRAAGAEDLAPTSACPVTSPTQMFCLHNWARAQHSVAPLAREPVLYADAAAKAADIEASGVFSHDPVGAGWDALMRAQWQAGMPWATWGENIAYGYATIRATFQAWLDSPGHRANILAPAFRFYGSAFRLGGLPRLWTVDFAG